MPPMTSVSGACRLYQDFRIRKSVVGADRNGSSYHAARCPQDAVVARTSASGMPVCCLLSRETTEGEAREEERRDQNGPPRDRGNGKAIPAPKMRSRVPGDRSRRNARADEDDVTEIYR